MRMLWCLVSISSLVVRQGTGCHPRHPPRAFPLGLLAPRCLGAVLFLASAPCSALDRAPLRLGGERNPPPSFGLLLAVVCESIQCFIADSGFVELCYLDVVPVDLTLDLLGRLRVQKRCRRQYKQCKKRGPKSACTERPIHTLLNRSMALETRERVLSFPRYSARVKGSGDFSFPESATRKGHSTDALPSSVAYGKTASLIVSVVKFFSGTPESNAKTFLRWARTVRASAFAPFVRSGMGKAEPPFGSSSKKEQSVCRSSNACPKVSPLS